MNLGDNIIIDISGSKSKDNIKSAKYKYKNENKQN